jgi:hypothetical protein
MPHIEADKHYGGDTKYAEKQFAGATEKLHPESHAVVFRKMKEKPITKNGNAFSDGHVGFYPKF